MTITKNVDGANCTLTLEGRLDTTTAPQLENEANALGDEINDVVLDFAKLEYISSAGLRVLLMMQKIMNQKGSMKIINACDDIIEVFNITGFCDVLTIE